MIFVKIDPVVTHANSVNLASRTFPVFACLRFTWPLSFQIFLSLEGMSATETIESEDPMKSSELSSVFIVVWLKIKISLTKVIL